MLDAISIAQASLNQDKSQLMTTNTNIANLNTPGFKQLVQANNGKQSIQLSNGSVTHTKIPTHFAILSEGFFAIETPKGVRFTRRGDFHLNQHRELVTHANHRVLSSNGPIVSHREGQIIKQLTLYSLEKSSIQLTDDGLFESNNVKELDRQDVRVTQGSVENSNVKTVDEMMTLIQIKRHFESNQRLIQTQASLVSQAINQLGDG